MGFKECLPASTVRRMFAFFFVDLILVSMISHTSHDRRVLWESRLRTVGINEGVKTCPGYNLPMQAFTLANETVYQNTHTADPVSSYSAGMVDNLPGDYLLSTPRYRGRIPQANNAYDVGAPGNTTVWTKNTDPTCKPMSQVEAYLGLTMFTSADDLDFHEAVPWFDIGDLVACRDNKPPSARREYPWSPWGKITDIHPALKCCTQEWDCIGYVFDQVQTRTWDALSGPQVIERIISRHANGTIVAICGWVFLYALKIWLELVVAPVPYSNVLSWYLLWLEMNISVQMMLLVQNYYIVVYNDALVIPFQQVNWNALQLVFTAFQLYLWRLMWTLFHKYELHQRITRALVVLSWGALFVGAVVPGGAFLLHSQQLYNETPTFATLFNAPELGTAVTAMMWLKLAVHIWGVVALATSSAPKRPMVYPSHFRPNGPDVPNEHKKKRDSTIFVASVPIHDMRWGPHESHNPEKTVRDEAVRKAELEAEMKRKAEERQHEMDALAGLVAPGGAGHIVDL